MAFLLGRLMLGIGEGLAVSGAVLAALLYLPAPSFAEGYEEPAYEDPVPVKKPGSGKLDYDNPTPRERMVSDWHQRRRDRLRRFMSPPPAGKARVFSIGLIGNYFTWRGHAGTGSAAPHYDDAFRDGKGCRLRLGLELLPMFELVLNLGYEEQSGRNVTVPDTTPWTVRFDDRSFYACLFETRINFPLGLHRIKWIWPIWAGHQFFLPYITPLRLGMLWHEQVDVVVNDPTPPAIVDLKTPYYESCSLLCYEFGVGLEFRFPGFDLQFEGGYRWASAPREDPQSILTNRSQPMTGAYLSFSASIRF